MDIDPGKARLYYADGRVDHYDDQTLAFAVWLTLPEGNHVAFRGANDLRPVYCWDYADVPVAIRMKARQ